MSSAQGDCERGIVWLPEEVVGRKGALCEDGGTDTRPRVPRVKNQREMSNLSYHQPRVPLAPNRLLLRTISGHKSYVSSVAFLGTRCDQLITGSYDEMAKVELLF